MKYLLIVLRFIGAIIIAFVYDFIVSTVALTIIGLAMNIIIMHGQDILKGVVLDGILSPIGSISTWLKTTNSITSWASNIVDYFVICLFFVIVLFLINLIGGLLSITVNKNKFIAIVPSLLLTIHFISRIVFFLFENPMYPGFFLYYIITIVVFLFVFGLYLTMIRVMYGLEEY